MAAAISTGIDRRSVEDRRHPQVCSAAGVVGLIGAEREEHREQAVLERAHQAARATVETTSGAPEQRADLGDVLLDADMVGLRPELAGLTSRPTVASTSTRTSASPARSRSNRSPESALKTVPKVTYARLPAARSATSEGRKENVAGTSAAGSRNDGGYGESTRSCA